MPYDPQWAIQWEQWEAKKDRCLKEYLELNTLAVWTASVVCCLQMDGRTFLSVLSLSLAVLRICALFMSLSSINFQNSLPTPGSCPRVTRTQTHTYYPLGACGEERKDKSPPNICFAYLPWPVCVYIFEEVWARGIHQYISTVVSRSVSVETLPDVIQISTGFFSSWPEESYQSDLKSRTLLNADLILYCLLRHTGISWGSWGKAMLL